MKTNQLSPLLFSVHNPKGGGKSDKYPLIFSVIVFQQFNTPYGYSVRKNLGNFAD